MKAAKQPLDWKTVTVRAKSKKRFVLIDDVAVVTMLRTAGRRFTAAPRIKEPDGFRLEAVYALPSNNVAEVFVAKDGRLKAYLFSNLDVWMSFADE